MQGQWLGRYESTGPNGTQVGNILIDIDEVDDAYSGYAVVQNDQANLPIVFTRFVTRDKSHTHSLTLNLLCFDPRNQEPTEWSKVKSLYPGVTPQ